MALSQKKLSEKLRQNYMDLIKKTLEENDEEVLQVKSNEFAIPCVNENGDDEFLVLTFKVPTGSRDGDPYDGYGEAQTYEMEQRQKKEKLEKSQKEKQEKIERDKKMREQKKLAKLEHNSK